MVILASATNTANAPNDREELTQSQVVDQRHALLLFWFTVLVLHQLSGSRSRSSCCIRGAVLRARDLESWASSRSWEPQVASCKSRAKNWEASLNVWVCVCVRTHSHIHTSRSVQVTTTTTSEASYLLASLLCVPTQNGWLMMMWWMAVSWWLWCQWWRRWLTSVCWATHIIFRQNGPPNCLVQWTA